MVNIGIIAGSTRPGRNNEAVARWYTNLHLLDDAVPPAAIHAETLNAILDQLVA